MSLLLFKSTNLSIFLFICINTTKTFALCFSNSCACFLKIIVWNLLYFVFNYIFPNEKDEGKLKLDVMNVDLLAASLYSVMSWWNISQSPCISGRRQPSEWQFEGLPTLRDQRVEGLHTRDASLLITELSIRHYLYWWWWCLWSLNIFYCLRVTYWQITCVA